jgi:hypothetical protein
VITYDKKEGNYVAHIELLDELEQIDTALCSAKRLEQIVYEVHDVLERETINSFYNNDKFDEEDEDSDDESFSGIQMLKRPTPSGSSLKFNVTKVEEK